MNVGPGIRAAIVAGVSAGITVSLMLISNNGSVTVHNTAAEAPADATTSTTAETTTTSEATTTTTGATTTTAAPTTTTTLSLEKRLERLEASTTTTTAVRRMTPIFYYESPALGGVGVNGKWNVVVNVNSFEARPIGRVYITVNTLTGPVEVEATPSTINPTYYVSLDPALLPPLPDQQSTTPVVFVGVTVKED
jgi:hypothetical protein